MLYTLIGSEKPKEIVSKKSGVKYELVELHLKANDVILNGIGNYVMNLGVFSSTLPDLYSAVVNYFNTGNQEKLVGLQVNLAYNQFGKISNAELLNEYAENKDSFKVY